MSTISRPKGRHLELCAEHVRQFGSESLLPNLMEVKAYVDWTFIPEYAGGAATLAAASGLCAGARIGPSINLRRWERVFVYLADDRYRLVTRVDQAQE